MPPEKYMRDAGTAASFGYLALAGVAVLAAMAVGQVTSGASLVGGGSGLTRPGFGSPSVTFTAVWACFYLLGAFAFWRVLRLDVGTPGRVAAAGGFIVVLMLDACWTTAFFGLRLGALALVLAGLLLLAIAFTTIRFWRLDAPAGMALVPYFVWVTYAGVVNLTVVSLTG